MGRIIAVPMDEAGSLPLPAATRNGMVMSWPKKVNNRFTAAKRSQFHTRIDIATDYPVLAGSLITGIPEPSPGKMGPCTKKKADRGH